MYMTLEKNVGVSGKRKGQDISIGTGGYVRAIGWGRQGLCEAGVTGEKGEQSHEH